MPSHSVIIQSIPRLRTNLQHPRHLIEQRLILNRVSTLQILDIVRLRIHFLGQLRLRHLIRPFLGSAVADGLSDLGADLLRRDDVVCAVDFCETGAVAATLGDLGWKGQWFW